MPDSAERAQRRILLLTAAVTAVHLALLLASLPDYWADNDLGYHISLARQYAIHGAYWWDHINWAPSGRPDLQGPLLHLAVGGVGRLLGGRGDDYVLAFSLLAVAQWSAAVFTAFYFAKRLAGERAALVAVALLTGGVFSAVPFAVGVPSGWIFIFVPWAIHFFLGGRYAPAVLFAVATTYVHLGGAPAAGLGLLLAALATRRWRPLLATGLATLVLTAPYWLHFLRHLEWYTGRRGHVWGSVNVLLYVLALPGLLWMLRRPREHLFPLLWAAAPLAWLFQDSLRFLLQSTIAGAVIAAVFVTAMLRRLSPRLGACVLAALVLVATVFPLSIPSLAAEWLWASGRGFPRELDWREARALAEVLEKQRLNRRIVSSYYDSLSLGMAVFTDLQQEYGHWGEVRPKVNPAANLPTAERVFVVPAPPTDPVLGGLAARGWIHLHGGSDATSLVTLGTRPSLTEAARVVADLVEDNGAWLASNATPNSLPDPAALFSESARSAWKRRMLAQRLRAGRIQVALLIYAHAADGVDPALARDVRSGARSWGSIANFLGDETALGYVSETGIARFRRNVAEFAARMPQLRQDPRPRPEIRQSSDRLFRDFFGT